VILTGCFVNCNSSASPRAGQASSNKTAQIEISDRHAMKNLAGWTIRRMTSHKVAYGIRENVYAFRTAVATVFA